MQTSGPSFTSSFNRSKTFSVAELIIDVAPSNLAFCICKRLNLNIELSLSEKAATCLETVRSHVDTNNSRCTTELCQHCGCQTNWSTPPNRNRVAFLYFTEFICVPCGTEHVRQEDQLFIREFTPCDIQTIVVRQWHTNELSLKTIIATSQMRIAE